MELKYHSDIHFVMDCGTASTATLLAAIAFLISTAVPVTRGEPDREQRVGRSDVRAVLGDKLDPSFWPTRGRRASDSSEETQPPFWANRGRSEQRLDDLQSLLEERAAEISSSEDNPPFWANRGRNVRKPCPDNKRLSRSSLFVDEPHWIIMDRRDIDAPRTESDPFWVARGRRALLDTLGTAPTEFWAARGKKSPVKKSVDAIRALELTNDQFWPARGKRDAHGYQKTHQSKTA